MTPEEVIQRGQEVAQLQKRHQALQRFSAANHANNRVIVNSTGQVKLLTTNDERYELTQNTALLINDVLHALILKEINQIQQRIEGLCNDE